MKEIYLACVLLGIIAVGSILYLKKENETLSEKLKTAESEIEMMRNVNLHNRTITAGRAERLQECEAELVRSKESHERCHEEVERLRRVVDALRKMVRENVKIEVDGDAEEVMIMNQHEYNYSGVRPYVRKGHGK